MREAETTKQLGTPFFYFLTGNVFTLIVGFTLQVYVANTLGAEKLGVFSLLEAGVGLVVGFIGFGIAPTLVKYIPQHLINGEHTCVRYLMFWCFFILLISGLAVYGLVLTFLPEIVTHWPDLNSHYWAISVMALMIPLGLISFYLQQCLRGFQEFRHMVFGSVFLQLILKVIIVILLFGLGMQLMGYIWAVVLSTLGGMVWMVYGLRKKTRELIYSDSGGCHHIKGNWVKYAKIMYSASLLGNSVSYIDRFALAYFGSAIEVGVLAVVKQLNQMPLVFMQLLLTVAAPMLSEASSKNDSVKMQHIYHLITDWVIRVSFPLFIFLIVFSEETLMIFGREFAEIGASSLIVFIVGQFINVLYGPIGILMNMTGHEKILLKLTFYQSIVMLIGIIVLVPSFGLVGAAVSIASTNIILNISCFRIAQVKIGIKWADQRYLRWILPMLSCTGCCILLSNWLAVYPPMYLVGYLIILYVVFFSVNYLVGFNGDDREIYHHLKKKICKKISMI